MMFMTILLTILIFNASVDEATTSPTPQNISMGELSLNGDNLKITHSGNDAFECVMEGRSRISINFDGDRDIAINAQTITIARDRNSKVTIRCMGDCRFSDSEHTCSAGRMEIQLKKRHITLHMSGGSRMQYGSGEKQTVLAGEVITFETVLAGEVIALEDKEFRSSGAASR